MHAHPRLAWTVAWLLALAGVALYLLYPTTAGFWVGFAAVVPLLVLVGMRHNETTGRSDDAAPYDAPMI